MKTVEIFTDGACRGNPGIGGWGAWLRCGHSEKKLYGVEAYTTNNRMELTAVIQALSSLKYRCDIDLTTDSQYVKNGITQWINRWKKNNFQTSQKKPVKNSDLWQQLDQLVRGHQIRWHWVKGHGTDQGNILADSLANQAIDEFLKRLD